MWYIVCRCGSHLFYRESGISITFLRPSYPTFANSSPSWFSRAVHTIPVSIKHYFYRESYHEMRFPGPIHRNPVWSSGSTSFCTSQYISHTTTDQPSVARQCSPFFRAYSSSSSWTGYWPLHMRGRSYRLPTVIDWPPYARKLESGSPRHCCRPGLSIPQ